jgi:hypothetical protein
MSEVKKQISDPDNYAKMSVPFENADAANEALSKFFDEIDVIRKKYKIPDVLIVTKGEIVFEEGIGSFMQHSNFGNSLNVLAMAAYVYGRSEQEHKERISKLLTGK